MDIGAGLCYLAQARTVFGVDGLAGAEVEGEHGGGLPSEVEIESHALPIDEGRGVGVEHILLVGVDSVGVGTRVEELDASADRDGGLAKGVVDILQDGSPPREGADGIGGEVALRLCLQVPSAVGPRVAEPPAVQTFAPFLVGAEAQGELVGRRGHVGGFTHRLVAPRRRERDAVFHAREAEDIAVEGKAPIA